MLRLNSYYSGNARNSVKLYEKSSKKVLTFAFWFGIINKHFARGSLSEVEKGPWKLNNDESKEPDKIQKSFICTRIERDTKQ